MAGFVKGDVVVLPFPFSDLSGSKRRPALVIADLPGNDILLCQNILQHTKDKFALPLSATDFANGSLPSESFIRPSRIFTSDKSIIIRKAGTIKSSLMAAVVKQIITSSMTIGDFIRQAFVWELRPAILILKNTKCSRERPK